MLKGKFQGAKSADLFSYLNEIDHESLIRGGSQFTDKDFPANIKSLLNEKTSVGQTIVKDWKQIVWKRASEMFNNEKFDVYKEKIEPNDIIQGNLGNCYFLSAISALAEFPNRVKDIFETDEVNKSGCYVIWICLNGEYKKIPLDDYFPCTPDGTSAFSKSKGNELWVLLLEKVWAKINHTYENTITGYTSEALRCLTGAPVDFYNHEYHEHLWDTIVESDRRNYIICASAGKPNLESKDYQQIGLLSDHAYAVIQVVEIDTKQYGKVRLLKLRNPWGHKEWMGEWSDKSDKWTPELREKLKFVDADDGIFFINYDDYMRYYRSTTICKVHDGFNLNSQKINCALQTPNSRPYHLFKVELKEKSKIFFTVVQPTKRFVTQNLKNAENYDTSFVKMILGVVTKDVNEPIRYLQAKCSNYDNISIESEDEYPPGQYIVLVDIDWKQQNAIQEFVLSTYSATNNLEISILNDDNWNFLEEVLKSCARQKTQKKNFEEKGDKDIFRCISITDSNAEYGYVYYENNSQQKATLFETCIFNKLENYEIMQPTFVNNGPKIQKNQFHLEIQPGQNAIIVLRRTDRKASYSVSYFSAVVFPDEYYMDDIYKKGKKQQVKYQGDLKNIYFYSYCYGVGYIWLFENNTQSTRFESNFKFQLENLKIKGNETEKGPTQTWNIILKPGETQFKRLVLIDPTQPFQYKYSYSFKCFEELQNQDHLIKIVKQQGQAKKIKYMGQDTMMNYYVHFINEAYVFFFENQERNKQFKATFNFVLENLRIEDEPPNTTSFKIELMPGEKTIKKIQRINHIQESNMVILQGSTIIIENVEEGNFDDQV